MKCHGGSLGWFFVRLSLKKLKHLHSKSMKDGVQLILPSNKVNPAPQALKVFK